MKAKVEVSGHAGGRDASAIVMPHWMAVKRAEWRTNSFEFPVPIFSLILRVDGELRQFVLRDDEYVDVARNRSYVSVDLHLTREDQRVLSAGGDENPIESKMRGSVSVLAKSRAVAKLGIDFEALQIVVDRWADLYLEEAERNGDYPIGQSMK